jgi:hypothetical protein
MSEDQRNDEGHGNPEGTGEGQDNPEGTGEGQGEPQAAGEYEDYSQQPGEVDPQANPEEDPEGYPEGYPEGHEEEMGPYRGRTGVPDYVPQDMSPPDPSLKESNKSGAIKLIVGIIVVLVLGGIGAYVLMGSQKAIKEHELARDAYKAANLKGNIPFWKMLNIPIGATKDITDFNRSVTDFMKEKTRIPFANRIKKDAVPILDAALPDYEAIKAPAAYADKAKAVVDSVKAIKEASLDLSGQMFMIDAALEAQTKLRRRSDAWFNAQTWEDPQYHAEAFDFYKLLTCVLDRPLVDIPAAEIANKILESCAEKKDAWFKRAAIDCYPALLVENATPDEAFKATVAAYRKKGEEAAKAKSETSVIDETSIDAIKECAETGRTELESALAAKLKAAFLSYDKAGKDFLAANAQALGGK